MIDYVKKAVNALPCKYGQMLIYDCLTGLRASESCESIKLLHEQAPDYFNEQDGTLEHYRYADVFIRRKKRAFVKMGYCRKIFATWMRERGVAAEIIDLYQGRIGKSVFARFYFRPDAAKERNRIRRLLPKLLNDLS